MGTGSFPGVKRPGRGADHPPPSNTEVKKEKSYTSTPLWVFGSVTGYLYLLPYNKRPISNTKRLVFVTEIVIGSSDVSAFYIEFELHEVNIWSFIVLRYYVF
jgi:hypothetical protein